MKYTLSRHWPFLVRNHPKTLRKRFEEFFFRDGPPHFLAAFRIVFGIFLFIHWSLNLLDVRMLFSDQGLVFPLNKGLGALWPSLFVPPTLPVAYALYLAMMISLALIVIGFCTRLALVLALALYIYYWHLFLHLLGGSFDRIFVFLLLVLLISGCDRTYSLRMYLKKGSWTAWEPVSVLPQRLIALQITALYIGVGWQKLWLPDWQSGEILRLSLMGRWATPIAFWWARQNLSAGFLDLSNEVVKFCQFVLPWMFWYRPTRWLAFGLQAFFLIVITVFLGMWWFLALIPASFAFWEPEDIKEFFSR